MHYEENTICAYSVAAICKHNNVSIVKTPDGPGGEWVVFRSLAYFDSRFHEGAVLGGKVNWYRVRALCLCLLPLLPWSHAGSAPLALIVVSLHHLEKVRSEDGFYLNGSNFSKVMAESHNDKLYKAEYAKSGRASCKKCKENIAKDSLRMAIMVQVT